MRVYLVQHGDALAKNADPERSLSDEGQADIQRLGSWLAGRGTTVSQILHSDKARARQTAELLEPLLTTGGRLQQREDLRPNDSPEAFLQHLKYLKDDTLVVSHMPFVLRVVSVALTGAPDRQLLVWKPGSIACIARDDSGPWQLVLFARPEDY